MAMKWPGEGEVTERKRAEALLQETRDEFWELYDNAPVGYHQIDVEGNIVLVNQTEATLLGYTKGEMLRCPIFDFVAEAERDMAREAVRKKIAQEQPIGSFERTYVRKDGSEIPVAIEEQLVLDEQGNVIGIRSTLQDISIRMQAEEQIRASHKEKEVLLKEIHHRVKNNLQIVSSLLGLQFGNVQDKQALEVLNASRDRVRSMALVHEYLYQSEDLARIDFDEYIRSLTGYLFQLHADKLSAITLNINVDDNILLDIDRAIPCGLIINELVSNSLKHAFPEGKEGEIKIALHLIDEDEFELAVSDNGIGIPEDLDFRNTGSLGLQLVTALVKQLDGEIELNRTEGTEFRIKFAF